MKSFSQKIFYFLVIVLALTNIAYARYFPKHYTISKNKFELVESVPKDTIYGQPGVRHTQTVWLDMINHAKKTIEIGAFYIQDTPHGAMHPIIEALKNAANRNVKVRIILDNTFYKKGNDSIAALQNIPNIKIRILPVDKITGGIMHAKYMVVDGKNCFVGSQNLDWRALDQIHEIGVRIKNIRLAKTILAAFNLDWQLCKTKNITKHPDLLTKPLHFAPVTVMRPIIIKSHKELLSIHPAFSPPTLLPRGLNWEQTQIINLLNSAQHQVVGQVLSYSTARYKKGKYWFALDHAIRAAAARGVQVYLIFSNWALRKHDISSIKGLAAVPNIHVKFSSIPEYKNKFMAYARVEHCKYMAIDKDLSWIGTGNWEWSYFNNTRNIAIIIYGHHPNTQLREIFFRDWNGPYVTTLNPNKNYKAPKIS